MQVVFHIWHFVKCNLNPQLIETLKWLRTPGKLQFLTLLPISGPSCSKMAHFGICGAQKGPNMTKKANLFGHGWWGTAKYNQCPEPCLLCDLLCCLRSFVCIGN